MLALRMLRTFIFAVALAASSGVLHAATNIAGCRHFFEKLARPPFDSSIEMELKATPKLMALFSTADGTLGPVLGDAKITSEFREFLLAARPGFEGDLKTIPWDSLAGETQIKVLEYAAQYRRMSFKSSRLVEGLEYKEFQDITFNKDTSFLGKTYTRGTHKIASGEMFGKTAIEFQGPKSMTQNLGFELHFRTAQSAGDNLESAWTLLDSVGVQRANVHQHVVAKIPDEILKDPLKRGLMAARLAEYYRRINLYAEMQRLLKGHNISRRSSDGYVYFGSMGDDELESVHSYFAQGAKKVLGSENKIAWVGMRGQDFYDQPNLWGLEFRDLSPIFDPKKLSRMLDASQSALVNQNFGIPEDKISRWLGPANIEGWRTWFTRSNVDSHRAKFMLLDTKYPDAVPSYSSLPENLKAKLRLNPQRQKLLVSNLKEAHKENKAVTLLSKDWSKDPLFFENPELLQKILEVQAKSLTRIMQGQNYSNVLKYFIKESEILDLFETSLGIDLPRLGR